jgi:hypothetical protein
MQASGNITAIAATFAAHNSKCIHDNNIYTSMLYTVALILLQKMPMLHTVETKYILLHTTIRV